MFKGFFVLILAFLCSCSNEPRVIDGDPEPPMPGFFERNFTWHGVDADKDGVIDDVEIWINNNIEDSNLRKAYKQYTMDMMIALSNVENKTVSIEKTLEMSNSIMCVSYFRTVLSETLTEADQLEEGFKKQMFSFFNSSRKERRQKMGMNFAGMTGKNTKRMVDYWQFCRFEVSNRMHYENIMKERFPGAFEKLLE